MTALRTCLAIVLLGALGGCRLFGLGGKLPPRELYRLAPPDTSIARAASAAASPGGGTARPALDGTLGVLTYETPGLYGESGIVFRVGDVAYGAYPSREWAMPLGDMLGQLTARLAEGAGLTREVPLYAPPSPRAQGYLWRARVSEFEEVNRDGRLLVAVRIDAAIVRTRDDSVVWSGSAGREHAVVGGTDMPAIVRSLSAVSADVITELLDRASRDLGRQAIGRRAPADAARATP